MSGVNGNCLLNPLGNFEVDDYLARGSLLFILLLHSMKQTLVFLFFSLLCIQTLKSQNPAASVLPQGPPALPMFIEDINGRPYTSKGIEDIEGTPFLFNEWNLGIVKFRNGRFAKGINLHFNVYNNQLYFKKDEKQLEFELPVQEFMIRNMKDGDSVDVFYRCGFPETEKTGSHTFLEELVVGNITLLKYRYKIISSFRPYNQPERKKFEDREQLFAFVDGKMLKFKKEKVSIVEALPQYKEAIFSIVEQKKLKLKNEEDIVKLFLELNGK